MKFLHVSDIHLGKRLHNVSLTEDQQIILDQILGLAKREDVDAILIAGDVYNRAQPNPEAITQFSAFLTELAKLKKPAVIIRGNHDGEAQLAYAAPLLAENSIHISEIFSGSMSRIELEDRHGPVHIYLLPYIKPVQARRFFPDDRIENYNDAVKAVLSRTELDPDARNILATHQYVMGAEVSDSEERSIGGLDQIPPETFAGFDYVALGHLHKSQTLAHGRIRYCGAPLVYSFDETEQTKSATLVTIGRKNTQNEFEFVPFRPLHPCRKLEGTLADLCCMPRSEDYVQIHLTDKVRPLDPVGTLKITYPNLLNLTFNRPDTDGEREEIQSFEPTMNPLEHFAAFYTNQNGHAPSEEQLEVIREIIQEGDRP